MPSVDPVNTFPVEIGGITFQVRELKVSGVRDIAKVMESLQTEASPLAVVDNVTSCALRYAIGWDKPEPLSQAALEDALTITEMMELLKAALRGSRLTDEQKKKSELQP